MKLLKFIVVILLSVFLGACTDSTTKENQTKKVVKKITLTSLDYNDQNELVPVTSSVTFSYLNGEVSKITSSDNFTRNFTYKNNKIVSSNSDNNNDLYTYTYTGNKLNELQSTETKVEFFYDSNDKLSEELASDITSNFTKKYSKKYYFLGNNINNIDDKGQFYFTARKVAFKYDTKNNPFKNQNSYFKLIYHFEDSFLCENNVIEETDENKTIKYTIIYDSNDYPIKITGINQKTNELWTEYTFEYTEI